MTSGTVFFFPLNVLLQFNDIWFLFDRKWMFSWLSMFPGESFPRQNKEATKRWKQQSDEKWIWSRRPVVPSHLSLIYFTFRAGENITFKGSGWFTGRDYLPRQITSKYITFSLYTSQECWQDIHQAHLSNAIIAPSDASPPRNPASSSLHHAVPPFPHWWKRETGGRER